MTEARKKEPTIVSFYSYKGGVGRTKVCANVAAYLCHQQNKKVLLWDWDLEAPGLHYFFYEKKNAGIYSFKGDPLGNGTMEVLEEYVATMRANETVAKEDLAPLFEKLKNNIVCIESPNADEGAIDLLPAFNYERTSESTVSGFNWFQFFNLMDGTKFIEMLKFWLRDNTDYDFVFIDSRTGINDYSGMCNVQLPEINVVIMVANTQNIEGSKKIIDRILNSAYVKEYQQPPQLVLPVLSRLDSSHQQYDYWLNQFSSTFNGLLEELDESIDPDFREDVFREVYVPRTTIEYVAAYSAGESLLFTEKRDWISSTSFASRYQNIGEYLLELKTNKKLDIFNAVSPEQWENIAERNKTDINKAAKALYHAGNYEDSVKVNANFMALWELFRQAQYRGDFPEMVEILKQCLELSDNANQPLSAEQWFRIGTGFNLLGYNVEAIHALEKSTLSPLTVSYYPYYLLARLWYEKKEYKLAHQASIEAENWLSNLIINIDAEKATTGTFVPVDLYRNLQSDLYRLIADIEKGLSSNDAPSP